MCVLIRPTAFAWNISHSRNKWARYDRKCLLVFMSDFNGTWIFSTNFQKCSDIKCNENPSSGSWVVDGRTDRHDEDNSFKVCKSVHHRTIQINHQPDATIFQFIILTFIYCSTYFGCSPAHHQELNDCSSSHWFYLRIVMIAVLLVVVLPTTNTAPLSPRYEGKTKCYHCSHWAPEENSRNMLSCKQTSG